MVLQATNLWIKFRPYQRVSLRSVWMLSSHPLVIFSNCPFSWLNSWAFRIVCIYALYTPYVYLILLRLMTRWLTKSANYNAFRCATLSILSSLPLFQVYCTRLSEIRIRYSSCRVRAQIARQCKQHLERPLCLFYCLGI